MELALDIKIDKIDRYEVHVDVNGTIDTTHAEQFGNFISDVFNQYPDKRMIIDFSNVSMITSACIRYLLFFVKQDYDFELEGVNREIFTVLKLTGMAELLDINQKAISIDTSNCKLLGKGFHSEVYKIDDEMIAKIYYDLPDIDVLIRERIISKAAFKKGVPTEISFGMCESNGRAGLLYELVDAKTLLSLLADDDSLMDKYICDYVKIVKEVHKYDGSDIPEIDPERNITLSEIDFLKNYLDEKYIVYLDNVVKTIEDSNNLVHGDPHPANVMVNNHGMLFIDLSDMHTGNEIYDLVYLYRTLKLFSIIDERTNEYPLNSKQTDRLWNLFFEEYYKDKDEDEKKELLHKIRILSLISISVRFLKKENAHDDAMMFVRMLKEEIENIFRK